MPFPFSERWLSRRLFSEPFSTKMPARSFFRQRFPVILHFSDPLRLMPTCAPEMVLLLWLLPREWKSSMPLNICPESLLPEMKLSWDKKRTMAMPLPEQVLLATTESWHSSSTTPRWAEMRQPSTRPPQVRLKITAVSPEMLLARTAFFAPFISTARGEAMVQFSTRLSSPKIETAFAREETLQPLTLMPEEIRLIEESSSGPMMSISDILQPGAATVKLPIKFAPGLPVMFRLRSTFAPE